MSRTPKHTFWAADGVRYGRVSAFPTADAFLTRIYNVTEEDDEDNHFFEDWKAEHSLPQFLEKERSRVKRDWFCTRLYGEERYIEEVKPGTRGAFELWEWES